MSYLARLKQQISPDALKCEPTKATQAPSVGSVGSLSEPLRDISDSWRELESLLAIVAQASNLAPNEVIELHQLARNNIEDALICYRDLVRQINAGG